MRDAIPEPGLGSQALAGASVVITRPAGTARALRRQILSRAGLPVSLPGLALQKPSDISRAIDAVHAARADDIWIFTSPSAVRFAFALRDDLRPLRRTAVFAVGRATASALARRGIAALAPNASQDAPGLLAMAALASVEGHAVSLFTAPGGRDLITRELERRGAAVRPVHVYQRAAPRLTRRHFEAVARSPSPRVMLLSSGEALRHLMHALPDDILAALRHETLVVSSTRLAARARHSGFRTIVIARSALTADLLAAAVSALAHHRL